WGGMIQSSLPGASPRRGGNLPTARPAACMESNDVPERLSRGRAPCDFPPADCIPPEPSGFCLLLRVTMTAARRTLTSWKGVLAALLLGAAGVCALPEARADKAPKATPPVALTKPAPEGVADLREMQKQTKAVLAKVVPATVGLIVGSSTGSGVIVSPDGYVLTARH